MVGDGGAWLLMDGWEQRREKKRERDDEGGIGRVNRALCGAWYGCVTPGLGSSQLCGSDSLSLQFVWIPKLRLRSSLTTDGKRGAPFIEPDIRRHTQTHTRWCMLRSVHEGQLAFCLAWTKTHIKKQGCPKIHFQNTIVDGLSEPVVFQTKVQKCPGDCKGLLGSIKK